MGDLNLKAASGGQIVLTPTNTASNFTLTLPAKTGNIITSADTGTVTQTMLGTNVAGNGPAFSAQAAVNQSITASTVTVVNFGTEFFDTNNNFASSRFTPTVAGYYQLSFGVESGNSTGLTRSIVGLRMNGTTDYYVSDIGSSGSYRLNGSLLIYMNGSGNYAEVVSFIAATTPLISSGNSTYFQGVLARTA